MKQDKGFGFDLRLVTVDEADMDEDQSRRVSEGDTVMALGKGAIRSACSPAWSARHGCWKSARCIR
jgi:hypothetical protein